MSFAVGNMHLTFVSDIGTLSEVAADIVSETLRANPQTTLTLPTGATPLHLFDVLAARVARREIDFSQATFFSLDDYLGLRGDEPNSLTAWLKTSFLDRVNFDPDRVHLVPAGAPDPEAAAARYDREISRRGGFDLAVLGIGGNGHIAFNEPGSAIDSRTRVVALSAATIEQASAYWNDLLPIPDRAMTVGIGTLLESTHIVVLASGAAKAKALAGALDGPISPDNPASYLRTAKGRIDIVADDDAAALLRHTSSVVDNHAGGRGR